MTNNEFKQYKTIANSVLDLLIVQKCSSLRDIKIIYNIIMGFPYCLDEEGHYVYNGKFYDLMDDLPLEALKDILHRFHQKQNHHKRQTKCLKI